jgi:hypothetical protein
MKQITLLFFYLLIFSQIVAQNCQENYKNDNRFKEIYDYLAVHNYTYTFPYPNDDLNGDYSSLTFPFNNYEFPSNAVEAERQFDNLESVGNILESLIRMYEITHDKAYLIKAINKSIQLMNARGGATAPDQYAWASGFNV